jgi:hypothetical protein
MQLFLKSSIGRFLQAINSGPWIVWKHLLVVYTGIQPLARLSSMLKMVKCSWKRSRLWTKILWYKSIDCNIFRLIHWKPFAKGVIRLRRPSLMNQVSRPRLRWKTKLTIKVEAQRGLGLGLGGDSTKKRLFYRRQSLLKRSCFVYVLIKSLPLLVEEQGWERTDSQFSLWLSVR